MPRSNNRPFFRSRSNSKLLINFINAYSLEVPALHQYDPLLHHRRHALDPTQLANSIQVDTSIWHRIHPLGIGVSDITGTITDWAVLVVEALLGPASPMEIIGGTGKIDGMGRVIHGHIFEEG
jgi:hypothetical protein